MELSNYVFFRQLRSLRRMLRPLLALNSVSQSSSTTDSSEDCFGKHRTLGRYYIAAMLFIVNAIYTWRFLNMPHSFLSAGNDDHFFYPALKDWTPADYNTFYYADYGGQICIQGPAALLIYRTSSHKFLTAAVAISSIFHMITPAAVALFPRSLAYMLYSHLWVQAPLRIGILSMWKNWTLPGKRMKFVFLSFSSLILSSSFSFFIDYFSNLWGKGISFYISGVCGIGWSFLWYFTVTDTPSPKNDDGLPTYEESCVQNYTFPTVKNRQKLSEVPWKGILTSTPVYALCLVYFKIGSSFVILMTMISIFAFELETTSYLGYTHFHIIFDVLYIVIPFTSTIATDIYITKYPRLVRDIGKNVLCAALIIHGILLLGTLFHHIVIEVICFCLSYFVFSITLAGFITNALDLSSQYVTIIGGFIETFYLLGIFLGVYYFKFIFQYINKHEDSYPYGKILLYEVAVTIFVAVVFMVWGSVEEQPWSFRTASDRRSVNTVSAAMREEL